MALTILAAMITPLLFLVLYDILFKTPPGVCHAKPVLAAVAGNGKVTLTWEQGSDQTAVKHWRYQQSAPGENTIETIKTEDAASAANSHIVSDLTNGVTYIFRVQGVLNPLGLTCWSNPVTVVPGHLRNVLGRIEEYQKAIAANGKALRKIGWWGVRALKELAKSTSEIAVTTAGIKTAVDRLASGRKAAGNVPDEPIKIAQADPDAEPCGEGEDCEGPPVQPESSELCEGSPLGEVMFGHDIHSIGEDNGDALELILAQLVQREGGLVLTEGYASSAGFERHNMHLSDKRAICVSECLRERLQDDGRFEFRAIAKGEAVDASDLLGMGDENQRVDVTFCHTSSLREPRWEARRRVGPDAEECLCPRGPS